MKENLYQMMKERYDHGDKLFPEGVIRNMMFQVKIVETEILHTEIFSEGVARPRLHAQTRLLSPRHEAGEPALHGPRPHQDRGLRPRQRDQVEAALH